MTQLRPAARTRPGLGITGNPDYDGVPFRDFSSVGPATRLDDLNLNWRERDLPEKERTKHVHRLHPYLGKFIPQVVEIFLRKYFAPGQTVLDPFCGCGTTLVQANELGINGIGYDISAFNILLTRAKTASYDIDRVSREVIEILERTRVATQCGAHQLTFDSMPIAKLQAVSLSETDSDYLQEWFAPQALKELLTYRRFIEAGDYENHDLLKIILSRSARSARLTTHFELDFPKRSQTTAYYCHKHSRQCSPTMEAFKFLQRYSVDTLQRVRQFAALRTDATVLTEHVDSRRANIPAIDGVITSPPYVGLIDYHDQHAYAYHLLGLQDRREDEIGPASNGSGEKAKRQYQQAVAEVFRRVADSLKPGGPMIVVAADRHGLYPKIAELAGVETETVIKRHVNRRTGRRSSDFYESVFIWRKA
jgi:hypothetical protein